MFKWVYKIVATIMARCKLLSEDQGAQIIVLHFQRISQVEIAKQISFSRSAVQSILRRYEENRFKIMILGKLKKGQQQYKKIRCWKE